MRSNDYHNRLQQIMTTVIESDIPAVEKKIEYETLLKAKRLVTIIAASLPYIPKMNTLAGLMGTNRNQLLKLFDFAKNGDFIVDGRYLFEIGGKGKGFAQIRNIPDRVNFLCPSMQYFHSFCI